MIEYPNQKKTFVSPFKLGILPVNFLVVLMPLEYGITCRTISLIIIIRELHMVIFLINCYLVRYISLVLPLQYETDGE